MNEVMFRKVMYNCSLHAEFIRDHADYGWDVTVNGFDWAKIKKSRDEYVRRLNGIYENNLNGVSIAFLVILRQKLPTILCFERKF